MDKLDEEERQEIQAELEGDLTPLDIDRIFQRIWLPVAGGCPTCGADEAHDAYWLLDLDGVQVEDTRVVPGLVRRRNPDKADCWRCDLNEQYHLAELAFSNKRIRPRRR